MSAARLVCDGSVREIRGFARRVIVVPHQTDAVDDHLHLAGDERHVGGAGADRDSPPSTAPKPRSRLA